MILDADLLQMVAEFLDPVDVDEATLALDAMREVGPGGHFFGAAHTQERYRTAFYAPMLSRLAELPDVARGGQPGSAERGQPDLEAAAGGLRGAAHGCRAPRGARRLRRPAQGRGRRAHRLLSRERPPVGLDDQTSRRLVDRCEAIGAYEAKTHLPRLLDEVEKGERITITKHGVPVAVLVPPSRSGRSMSRRP